MRGRHLAAVALVVLGGITTFAAATAGYLDHVLVDRDGFAEKVVEAVKEPEVSRELSDRLASVIVNASPDVVAGQRLLEDAGQSIIAGGALDPVVRRAALLMHDEAFTGEGENLVLDVADGIEVLGSVLGTQAPELRAELEPAVEAEVVKLRRNRTLTSLKNVADSLAGLALVLPVAAVLLFAGAVAIAADRGRAFRWTGFAVIAAALGLAVGDAAARLAVEQQHFVAADAAEQAAAVFLDGLLPLSVALGIAGAVIAAAGSGRFTTDTADRAIGRSWTFLRTAPETTGRRVLRVLALALVAWLLLAHPLGFLKLAALAVGLLAAVEALTEVIALLGGVARGGAEVGQPSRRSHAAAFAAGAIGVAAVVGIAAYGLTRVPSTHASVGVVCNGSEELCDRPIDRVAFATAHNAMSSAEDGFVDPNHRRSLVKQLDAGIRGLLVDSLMARPTDRRSSALTVLDGEVREAAERELGGSGTSALQDILARRLARPTGPPQPYLCHVVCELGALPMRDELTKIRDWLERNPSDVLVIVVQDLVSPEDTERMFRESGLYDHVWTWNVDDPAPTLRQMIDADRRLLVMAEEDGFRDGWYQPGYERLLKETPFDSPTLATLASDASCRPNRGHEENPLFLVNSWVAVYPPRPSAAKTANSHDVLLRRVQRCRELRKAFPNLIAVDFAGIGDVVAVAAEVNRVALQP